MLTLNASTLRATLNESALSPLSGGPAPASTTDPAGFASLLRQTRAAPPPAIHAPTPQPLPVAPSTPNTHASSSTHEPDHEAANPSASEATGNADAPQQSDPSSRTRALPSGKPRGAANATPSQRGPKPASEAAGTSGKTSSEVTADKHGTTQAGDTPIDPSTIMQWLAGLQRAGAASVDAGGAKGSTDAKAALAESAQTLGGNAGATRDAAQGLRAAELKADAALTDKAAQGAMQLGAAASQGQFAATLAEQRVVDKSQAQQASAVTGLQDAAASSAAAAFTPPVAAGREAAPPVAVALATPLTAPDFAQALGLQMSVLARDGVQHAELHLNPAEMGPVSVQIAMDGTQARVDFGADMAATRHAIEAGLPELASALRDAGFTLAGGGVSQHSSGRSDGGDTGSADGGRKQRSLDGDAVSRVSAAARRVVTAGGIDLFA